MCAYATRAGAWAHFRPTRASAGAAKRRARAGRGHGCALAHGRRDDARAIRNRRHLAPRRPLAHALDAKELRAHLVDALERLPDVHREALVLREVDGLAYDEIAAAMGCPVGTVMSRLFHARRKMQVLLREADPALAEAA